MRIVKILLPAAIVGLVLSSCANSSSSIATGGPHPTESALLWQQTSAEYEALCYQAFEVAKNRIKLIQAGGVDSYSGSSMAVILDIDETVLDNSPYFASLALKGKEGSESAWDEWVKMEKAELIPGALDFLNFTRDQGIKYFFISNRKTEQLKSTYNNLYNKGVELSDGDLLLDNGQSKQERREGLTDYEIVLIIGDNLSDFDPTFEGNQNLKKRSEILKNQFTDDFGNRFILMPNPLYGDWKKAVRNESKKREGQLELLKSY